MIKKALVIILAVITIISLCPSKHNSFAADAIELEDLRTLSSKTFVLSDGTFSTTFYAEPIHYINGSGKYVEINSSLTSSNKKDFVYMNTTNSWQTYFSSTASASKLMSIISGDYELSFKLNDSISTISDIATKCRIDSENNNKIIYKNVFPNVDLRYTVHSSAVKEEFILHSPESIPNISFTINTSGLKLQTINGYIAFTDSNGNSIFELGSHYMEDSAGKRCELV